MNMRREALTFMFTLALPLLAAACHEHAAPSGRAARPTLTSGDVVVARVNGQPITAARVAAHAGALGFDRRKSLDDLIAFELLADEAVRRGHLDDPEVEETRRRESVRRFLKLEFEGKHGPEVIPEQEVRVQFERNRFHFDHPELSAVMSVVFRAARGKATPEEEARAQGLAVELAARLRASHPKDAAEARAFVETNYGRERTLRIDQFNTYPGAPADPDWLKEALKLRVAGDISPPVRSAFGWHVIYLAALRPALHVPEAEALAIVRREFHPTWQRSAYERFVEEIAARHATVTHRDLLGAHAPSGSAGGAQPGRRPGS
jgi:hypothetical protein